MTRKNKSCDFGEQYKNVSRKLEEDLDGDDPPRIVEETDTPKGAGPVLPAHVVTRKCKVHRTKIEGINYTCRRCGSVFCLACITNVLLPDGKCMVCEAPFEIDDEFRSIIDRAARHTDTGPFTPGGQVTIIAPEIWRRFEELNLEEDVIDEIIDRLKYVSPKDRLKYLNAYFNDEEERDNQL
jgi:hypothetical protein